MLTKTLSVASIAAILLTSLASAADLKVTIKEWDTKTTGAFPHDPSLRPRTEQSGKRVGDEA